MSSVLAVLTSNPRDAFNCSTVITLGWFWGEAPANGSPGVGFKSRPRCQKYWRMYIAEKLPRKKAFGFTSRGPQVNEINSESSVWACQLPYVGLARKSTKIWFEVDTATAPTSPPPLPPPTRLREQASQGRYRRNIKHFPVSLRTCAHDLLWPCFPMSAFSEGRDPYDYHIQRLTLRASRLFLVLYFYIIGGMGQKMQWKLIQLHDANVLWRAEARWAARYTNLITLTKTRPGSAESVEGKTCHVMESPRRNWHHVTWSYMTWSRHVNLPAKVSGENSHHVSWGGHMTWCRNVNFSTKFCGEIDDTWLAHKTSSHDVIFPTKFGHVTWAHVTWPRDVNFTAEVCGKLTWLFFLAVFSWNSADKTHWAKRSTFILKLAPRQKKNCCGVRAGILE